MSVLYPDLPQTTFPSTNDTFITNADISESDAVLVKQFQDAVQAQNFVLAQSILVQIPNYTQKILTSSKLNKFNECLTALERFYSSDVQSYITTKQSEWQATVDQFTYGGVYSPSVQYYVNNYVSYTSNGVTNLYVVNVQPPIGTAPTNTNYWRVLTVKGLTGGAGSGMEFMGDWNSAQSYRVLDCVTYKNSLWGCLTANSNQEPIEGSSYWQLVYQGSFEIYPVSATEPTSPANGSLWFQII